MFFYNRDTGAAAVGQLDGAGDFTNLKDFSVGTFGNWTHIVFLEGGQLFFYHYDRKQPHHEPPQRAAASGQLDSSGEYTNLKDFPAGQFGYWTHITSVGGRLFFYNVGYPDNELRALCGSAASQLAQADWPQRHRSVNIRLTRCFGPAVVN